MASVNRSNGSRASRDADELRAMDLSSEEVSIDENKVVGLSEEEKGDDKKLLIAFAVMVVIGLGNNIFRILQLVPMRNYGLFTNLLTTFVYIPISFAYILPMIRWGNAVRFALRCCARDGTDVCGNAAMVGTPYSSWQITPEARSIPKYKWMIMGFLDSVAGIMQTLGTAFVGNGTLVVLLMQSAIPTSMITSKLILRTKYKIFQYIGAAVVGIGIVVVLLPQFLQSGDSGSDDSGDSDSSSKTTAIWAMVIVLSCIPMCLSSIYKEIALGSTEVDVVYLNGWVALFQLIAAIPILYPSALAEGLQAKEVWVNVWNGMKCLAGKNTIMMGKHPDNCSMAPIYVPVYTVFNLLYNVLIILLIKFGGSNILWLCMTMMVPLGSLFFALPFVPAQAHSSMHWETVLGLVVIFSGLCAYRFWPKVYPMLRRLFCLAPLSDDEEGEGKKQPLLGDDSLQIDDASTAASESPGFASTPIRGSNFHVARSTRHPRRSGDRDIVPARTEEAPF